MCNVYQTYVKICAFWEHENLRPLHVHFVNEVYLIWTVSWLIGYKLGQIHDILAKTGTQPVDMGVRFRPKMS